MENIDILKEVQKELERFTKKLELAMLEQSTDHKWFAPKKDYAACKRAALDLKRELTKLSQDTKYKYGNK